MKLLSAIVLAIFIAGCSSSDKEVSYYPDCFKELTASPYKSATGCGNLIVAVELDDNRLVSIFLNDQFLGLKTRCKSFKVESDTNNIKINYYTYRNDPDSINFFSSFCNDAFPISGFGSKTTWKAVSGIITAVVSREGIYRKECEGYRISVKLDNTKFIKENSTQDTTISGLIIKDQLTGICIP